MTFWFGLLPFFFFFLFVCFLEAWDVEREKLAPRGGRLLARSGGATRSPCPGRPPRLNQSWALLSPVPAAIVRESPFNNQASGDGVDGCCHVVLAEPVVGTRHFPGPGGESQTLNRASKAADPE